VKIEGDRQTLFAGHVAVTRDLGIECGVRAHTTILTRSRRERRDSDRRSSRTHSNGSRAVPYMHNLERLVQVDRLNHDRDEPFGTPDRLAATVEHQGNDGRPSLRSRSLVARC
jgi:hypothetical protein